MKTKNRIKIVVALIAISLCGEIYAQDKPNVLFVFADQFRNHAMAFNGEDLTITPNLDKLSEEGVVFNNAVSSCPVCTPFRGMLISGKYPLTTGVTRNCSDLTPGLYLRADNTSFGNAFKENGYQTGYIGKWHLDDAQTAKDLLTYKPDGNRGWDTYTPPGPKRQGFDFWHAYNAYDSHESPHYWEDNTTMIEPGVWSPEHETDVAIDFINNRENDKPFLLMISYNPPHPPIGQVPDRYLNLYANEDPINLLNRQNVVLSGDGSKAPNQIKDYFAAVSGIDDQFGRLVDYLKEKGLFENTIVVFTADHGEMMGSHGKLGKNKWYEEAINTPLIVSYPEKMSPGVSNCLVSPVDFLPSLLGLADIDIPENYDGLNLSSSFMDVTSITQDTVFLAAYGGDPYSNPDSTWLESAGWRGIRTLTHTYAIRKTNGVQSANLYDLQNDKWQLNPVSSSNPEENTEMKPFHSALKRILKKMNDPFLDNVVVPTTNTSSQNLLQNPGFESGDLTGWNSWKNGVTNDANKVLNGSFAGYIKAGQRGSLQQNVNLKSNTTYLFSIWAKVASAGEKATLIIQNYGGEKISIDVDSVEYKKYEISFTTEEINEPVTVSLYKYEETYGQVTADDFGLFDESDTISTATREIRQTFYVDAAFGSDDYNGFTPDSAWKSLNKVNFSKFIPGDSILFKAGGMWNGQLLIESTGTRDAPIVFSRYGEGEKPQINGKGQMSFTLRLLNSSYTEASEFDITNTGTSREGGRNGVLLHAFNKGDIHNTVIRNLDIHDVNGSLIKPEGGGSAIHWAGDGATKSRLVDALIEGCYIYNCERNGMTSSTGYGKEYYHKRIKIRENLIEKIPGDGIVPNGCDSALVEYNICRDFTDELPNVAKNAAAGIWPFNSSNTVIQYNEVSGHQASWDGQGFDSDWNCENTIIQYNYSHDNCGGFILICSNGGILENGESSNVNSIVRYNISVNDGYRTWGTGADFCPTFHLAGPIHNTMIYNNTIYMAPKPASVETAFVEATNWGSAAWAWPDTTYFYNNIFYATETTDFVMGQSKNNTFSHNLFHGPVSAPSDNNSIDADPQFINAGKSEKVNNYKLLPTSPAIQKGKIIENNGGIDFFGNFVAEDTAPNIGAYNGEGTITSINNLRNKEHLFSIYPNIVNDSSVTVQINNLVESATISLVSLTGKVLNVKLYEELNAGTLDFDLGNLRAGIYFVMLTTPTIRETKKIIKI